MYKPQDHVQQIADHIKKNLIKGYTMESLKFSLMNQGYSRISIEKAMDIANLQLALEVPVMKEKPQITYTAIPEVPRQGFFKRMFKKLFG